MKYKKVCIEQHESYPKQTYRNRCEIYAENGKMALTIPVKKVFGNNTKTSDIQIFNGDRWYLNHWRAIESAYLASPFFLYYRDELESFYTGKHTSIPELTTSLIRLICELIEIDVDLSFSEEFEKEPVDALDMRFMISPKKSSTLDVFPEYIQVFDERHGFIPNLSIIDVLFNLGPETKSYLADLGTSK